MAKKIKQKGNREIPDPQLDVVDDPGSDIEYDEELNEAVLVHHYRRKFGDEFDADIEHGYNTKENAELIATLGEILKIQLVQDQLRAGSVLPIVPTPTLVENNPLDSNRESLKHMVQSEKEEKK